MMIAGEPVHQVLFKHGAAAHTCNLVDDRPVAPIPAGSTKSSFLRALCPVLRAVDACPEAWAWQQPWRDWGKRGWLLVTGGRAGRCAWLPRPHSACLLVCARACMLPDACSVPDVDGRHEAFMVLCAWEGWCVSAYMRACICVRVCECVFVEASPKGNGQVLSFTSCYSEFTNGL